MRITVVIIFFGLLVSGYTSVLAQTGAESNSADTMIRQRQEESTVPIQSQRNSPTLNSTIKTTSETRELPAPPKSERSLLPDIVIKGFKFLGPSGPWRSGETYSVGVDVQNMGQIETGVFLVEVTVKVQAPSIRRDETSSLGTRRIRSIQPRKTGKALGRATVWFNYTTGNDDGATYTFTAVADSSNLIQELNEANNKKTSEAQTVDTRR